MNSDVLILLRALHFAATLCAGGTVAFMVLVAEPAPVAAFAPLRRRFVWLIWIALAVALLSGLGWLVLLASDILGASIADVCLHGGAASVLAETRFGQVWMARLALALLLTLLMPWPTMRWLQLAAALGIVALPAWVGHAGATPGTAGTIHLAADTLHLIAAAAWLGALPALVMLLAQARLGQPSWAAAATNRFSLIGIASVGTLLASGLINAWNLLAGPNDLLTTDYGRLVALKIGLFAAMVVIATVNRFHLTPRLAAPGAMRALQRNSLAETGLGLGVLLLVGALGTMSPTAHVHPASTEIPPDAAYVHIHDVEVMADVTIDPGRAGPVRATIHVLREDFSRFDAVKVRLMLDPPAPDLPKIDRAAEAMPDGSWRVEAIDLPRPGIWTAKVIITPTNGVSIVLDAPIVIEAGR